MGLSGTSLSLEAELAAIAEDAEPGRTARIAVRHWGWDGHGGATLETTGREFQGITRERVRQLCERLARNLRERGTTAPAAPALDAAQLEGVDELEGIDEYLTELRDELLSANAGDS